MNKPKRNEGKKLFRMMLMGLTLMLTGMSVQAQNRDEETEEGDYADINRENFKSDFGNEQNERVIDYSRGAERVREGRGNNYDVFGNNSNREVPVYKFEEENAGNADIRRNNAGGGVVVQGGSMGEGPVMQAPGNASMPAIKDPFRQGQTGVKAPRNMDAVPDNGDEPNDVPLDGGIALLGLAALGYGMRRK